jgi:hypothetical protein
MDNAELRMENNIGIRLLSVTFPDTRNASVAFELYSDGYTVGEPHRHLLTFTQETAQYKLDATGLPDYNEIVGSASKKLESDFRHVLETLAKTYASS